MLQKIICWHIIVFITLNMAYSQSLPPKVISMNQAVALTLENNPMAKNAELQVEATKYRSSTSLMDNATEVNYANGQFYGATNDSYFEVNQRIASPLSYFQKKRYQAQAIKLSETEQKATLKKLTANAKAAYVTCVYRLAILTKLKEFSISYNNILAIHGVPYNPNDSNQLERTMAETDFASFQNKLFQAEQNCTLALHNLQTVLQSSENYMPSDSTLELYAIEIMNSGKDKFAPTTLVSLQNQTVDLYQKELQVRQSVLFPEISAGYFNHSISGNKGFQGFKVGVAIPLWFFPQKAKINEARVNLAISRNEAEYKQFTLNKTIENLRVQLDQLFVDISFYRENALRKAELLVEQVNRKMQTGNLNYVSTFQELESAITIQLDYLDKVNGYNQTAIELEALID